MVGSDFDPEFFTNTDRNNFQTILTRLRAFDKTVAHSFRNLEQRIDTIEENVKTNKNSLSGTKDFREKMNLTVTQNESEDENEINEETEQAIIKCLFKSCDLIVIFVFGALIFGLYSIFSSAISSSYSINEMESSS
uniref:Uncharacterized protein n=1 Tax=Meloidogyne floridensis TaxID=298350 RepID=A0A915PGN3_9BILA